MAPLIIILMENSIALLRSQILSAFLPASTTSDRAFGGRSSRRPSVGLLQRGDWNPRLSLYRTCFHPGVSGADYQFSGLIISGFQMYASHEMVIFL